MIHTDVWIDAGRFAQFHVLFLFFQSGIIALFLGKMWDQAMGGGR